MPKKPNDEIVRAAIDGFEHRKLKIFQQLAVRWSSGGPPEEKAIALPSNPLRRFMKGNQSRPECNSTP
jgi:hypothetical protein